MRWNMRCKKSSKKGRPNNKAEKQGFEEIFGIVSKLLDCADCSTNLHDLTWKWSMMVNTDIIKKSLERVM